MIAHSRIFMLPPREQIAGCCGVCGYGAIMRYRDASTGIRVGQCCRGDLVRAEMVMAAAADIGIRHPALGELDDKNH